MAIRVLWICEITIIEVNMKQWTCVYNQINTCQLGINSQEYHPFRY